MTGHTPGPWRAEFDHPDLPCLAHIVAGGKGIFATSIATLYGPDDTKEGTEPDAYLIAAAPELLQALRDLYLWANTNDPSDRAGNETAPLAAARAAIAKATGAA